jgi:hypothetical protein
MQKIFAHQAAERAIVEMEKRGIKLTRAQMASLIELRETIVIMLEMVATNAIDAGFRAGAKLGFFAGFSVALFGAVIYYFF